MRVLTWRTFLSLLILALVLSVLFTFSSCMVDASDEYERNAAAEDESSFQVEQATSDVLRAAVQAQEAGELPAQATSSSRTAVFIGDAQASAHVGAVRAWCAYDKRALQTHASLKAWFSEVASGMSDAAMPDVVIVDPAALDWDEADLSCLQTVRGCGVTLVFCDLPSQDVIAASAEVREMLGIASVHAQQVELTGLHLFEGLLAGEERSYIASDDDPDLLDGVNLMVAWYDLAGGAVAYLRGCVDTDAYPEAYLHDEVTPPLIWRYGDGESLTFVVQGSYLEGDTGAGLLNAFAYEASDYALYPIANAQVLAIDAMPLLANENSEQLQHIYARDALQLQRDVVWASLQRMVLSTGATPTFYALAHLDAAITDEPQESTVEYYLRSIYELGGEMGFSLTARGQGEALAKAQADAAALDLASADYTVTTLSATSREVAASALELGAQAYADVRTVILAPAADAAAQDAEPLAGLLATDEGVVTTQRATSDLRTFGALDDLRLRAQETLLGYSVARMPMESLFYPSTDDDQWQAGYRQVLANYETYWAPYRAYDQLSATQADARLRTMAALSYETSRSGDTIELTIGGRSGDAYFALRTHGEKVVTVQGGEATLVQDGWYVIRATADEVRIELAPQSVAAEGEAS